MSLNSLPLTARNCKQTEKSSKHGNEEKEYDSSDSLDQLLDNAFIPNHSQPKHMRNDNATPKKSVRASGGGKRAKALALMASTAKSMKTATRCKSSKQQFKRVCKHLMNNSRDSENDDDEHKHESRHVVLQTPALLKPRVASKLEASLCTSRDIITPTPYPHHHRRRQAAAAAACMTTPLRSDALKLLQTPCTPTPIKLIRTLNVRTPKVNKKETRPATASTSTTVTTTLPSWKDLDLESASSSKQDDTCKSPATPAWDALVARSLRLPLPLKWTLLKRKFSALESMLSLFMRKNSFFVDFEQIEHSVQSVTKKKFSRRDLQQILSVVPDFYHVQWTACVDKMSHRKQLKLSLTALEYDPYCDQQTDALAFGDDVDKTDKRNTNKQESKLDKVGSKLDKVGSKLDKVGTKFLKVSKLTEREHVFRHRLIELLAQHHRRWLCDRELIEFDPLQTGKWHPNFELESVREIELTALPCQPQKSTNEIERMIAAQKAKLQRAIDAEMERLQSKSKGDKEQTQEQKKKELVIPSHLKHLSPSLILKIRAKQQHKQSVNAKELHVLRSKCGDSSNDNSGEEKSRWQQLPYVVQLMRGIYVSMKKSSLPCNELVQLIKRRHRNPHVIHAEIWKQLQMLSKLECDFFIIKQGSMVKVAKINKNVATKDVLQEINGKIQN